MTIKKQKPSKTTVATKPTERKKAIYLGDYYCMKEMQPKPVTEGFLKVLADKLVQWVEEEASVIHLRQFLQLVGIRDKDFHKWRERSQDLQHAHEWAMSIMGMRREMGAINKKYDGYMISKTLYQYSPEYKEATEYHSKLAKKDAEAVVSGMQFVVIPKIQSDDENFSKEK